MDSLSLNELLNTMKKFEENQPQFNNEAIDKMIESGNAIDQLIMIHSIPDMQDLKKVKTKHGYIETQYTKPIYLEYGTAYIMKKPELFSFSKS